MRSSHFFALAVAFALCSGPFRASATTPGAAIPSGAADTGGFSSTYVSCLKSANEKILAVDACMSSELEYQDARLNKTYKALLDVLEPDARKALVEAERAWLQSRSGDEDFESALFGDTQAGNAQQLENKLHRLCARANALDRYLAFAEL